MPFEGGPTSELLADAWRTASQTASYLYAYAFVLVLAPIAHLVLVALAPGRRGWLGAGGGALAGAVLGLTEPLSRRAFERNLRRLDRHSGAITYLSVSHALTAYSWILLGPLLGKDFLLSHVVGVTLFAVFATVFAHRSGVPAPASRGAEESGYATSHGHVSGETAFGVRDAATRLGGATLRFVGLAALGLGIGGLVAAWGFSPATWAPAELGSGGLWTQLSNAGIGGLLALVAVPPLANLFVGTYLWKIGLAHAGIVTFLCAATAAPSRWRLYARLYGRGGAVRLVLALLVAALAAGLTTAWLFGAFDLSIHYKLIPEQLWSLS